MRRAGRAGWSGSRLRAGRVAVSQMPRGSRRAATIRSKTRGPGTSSTRMTDPAIKPGRVPMMRTRASRPPVWCCRRYRYSALGVETTL